jgi:undecaprenyl-diphosphatase
MPEWIKVVLLGVLEGITEFLPVSSTGHLVVTSQFIQLSPELRDTFDIVIQLGGVLAVLFFYQAELRSQALQIPTSAAIQRLWLGVLLAFIPAAVVGLLFRDAIKTYLFAPVPIALALIVGGIVLIFIERLPHAQITSPPDNDAEGIQEKVSLRQALWVGFAQVFALVPGVSRSGASIVGGMLAGMNRNTATQFSFYLAIPTLGAATVLEFVTGYGALSQSNLGLLALGTLTAGGVAWLSIRWLLRYISGHNFVGFGYYRICIGVLILAIHFWLNGSIR